MVCSTVVEGAFLTDSVWVVVVVVVVGAGFSTTVVQEVKSIAAPARSGVRMISLFIVRVFPSQDESAHIPRPDVFRTKIFLTE